MPFTVEPGTNRMLFGLSVVDGVGSSGATLHDGWVAAGVVEHSQRIHQALLEFVDLPTHTAGMVVLIPVVGAGQPLDFAAAARQLDLLAENVELVWLMSSTRSYWLLSQSVTPSASCPVCAVSNCRFRLSDIAQLISSEVCSVL